ncbi:MAG: glycosyltransferase family 2 protein [Alphaproteobacteria bacterium]|nr:glycosyltransferase family 2 protein [Alphaproteobacteria bacterium]
MTFSLVIPCYNEAGNLPSLLERCDELSRKWPIEVVLVDNGSTDNTRQVLEMLLPGCPGVRSVRVDKNRGYGFGILTGLRSAKGNIIGWTHADMQTDPFDFVRGVALFSLHGKNIMVKGRRIGRPLADVFFTFGMSVFETLLLKIKMNDINAQPTMFSREFFESWNNPPHDFSLDLYAYYMALKNGIAIHRIPVSFKKRVHGRSSWNVGFKSRFKFICRTIDYSFKLKKDLKNSSSADK